VEQRSSAFAQGETVARLANRLQLRETPPVPGAARELVGVARDRAPRGIEIVTRKEGTLAIRAKMMQLAGIEAALTLAAFEELKEAHRVDGNRFERE
jgi:hypothetical protein